jgi:hypothetical protein
MHETKHEAKIGFLKKFPHPEREGTPLSQNKDSAHPWTNDANRYIDASSHFSNETS